VARMPRGQGLESGERATLTLVRERSEVRRATSESSCAVPAGRQQHFCVGFVVAGIQSERRHEPTILPEATP
jgi:hypothetical protein